MPGTLRLSKIVFVAGPHSTAAPLEVVPSTVTVLVGPNNSGKSLALREIEARCFGRDARGKVVSTVQVDFPVDPDVAERLLREFETSPPKDRSIGANDIWIGQHMFYKNQMHHEGVDLQEFRTSILNKQSSYKTSLLSRFYTVRLDGRTRFALTDDAPRGDLLQGHAQNHLWALFKNDAMRNRVRELTAEAFELHFVVDPTEMVNFRIRMSPRPPTTPTEEQALDTTARAFHAAAQPISEFSDGVQAFVGLVSAVLSLPHKILLIDEPDAFLHPPLARRLATDLARLATERNASLVVSTHSADYLWDASRLSRTRRSFD